ncbi:carboxypeptidase regulatory-like domain-containing protein [Dysgonomonas sp. 25]|uniref:carboxypeptidase regulatory-like domain-containing protein n=1 Tax=Dysgonomonas sp. 25 TaxID=2302933 RepID=UPI0013D01623|nr:carboxypeptidase regulatory-like domain-containing protein [Dysgonomonas sp. 25]NDV70314.1 hypothetical protein [Dysgonomonas sp. 25]
MKKMLLLLSIFALSLSLAGQEARIMGKVTNLKKEAIADAVLVLMKDKKELATLTTQKEGTFTFENVGKGIYTIKTTHPNYEESLTQINIKEEGANNVYIHSIALENEESRKAAQANQGEEADNESIATLNGTVVVGKISDLMGNPLLKAHVELIDEKGTTIKQIKSRDKGIYAFTNVEAGIYTIKASHPDYESAKGEVKVDEPDEEAKGSLVMKKGPSLILENEADRASAGKLPQQKLNEIRSDKAMTSGGVSVAVSKNKLQGSSIAEFSLKDIKGKTWTNKSILGKPTVINFWHAGCMPCIKEMPQMNKWIDEYPEVNFLSCTWNSSEVARPIIERTPFLFNNMIDGQDLFDKHGIRLTPTTLVIDKDGVIQSVVIGASSNNLQRIIDKVKELSE